MQARGAGGIYRQSALHPAGETGVFGLAEGVTAGQHGHRRARRQGQVENLIGQPPAGVNRDRQRVGCELDVLDLLLL